jgi:hypothetical protein
LPLCSVPLYYHVKFAILVWLQFPSNGVSCQNSSPPLAIL